VIQGAEPGKERVGQQADNTRCQHPWQLYTKHGQVKDKESCQSDERCFDGLHKRD